MIPNNVVAASASGELLYFLSAMMTCTRPVCCTTWDCIKCLHRLLVHSLVGMGHLPLTSKHSTIHRWQLSSSSGFFLQGGGCESEYFWRTLKDYFCRDLQAGQTPSMFSKRVWIKIVLENPKRLFLPRSTNRERHINVFKEGVKAKKVVFAKIYKQGKAHQCFQRGCESK